MAEVFVNRALGLAQIRAQVAVQFEAKVVWMAEEPLLPGRNYLMKIGAQTVDTGMLDFAVRRSQNIPMQHMDIEEAARAALKQQQPCVMWGGATDSWHRTDLRGL